MIIAISSFYKDNPKGLEIAKHFRRYVIEGLVEAGVYGSIDEAIEFVKSRLDAYDRKSSNKDDNYLMNTSIQLLKFIEQNNTLLLVNTSEQITTIIKANKNLIDTTNKEVFKK